MSGFQNSPVARDSYYRISHLYQDTAADPVYDSSVAAGRLIRGDQEYVRNSNVSPQQTSFYDPITADNYASDLRGSNVSEKAKRVIAKKITTKVTTLAPEEPLTIEGRTHTEMIQQSPLDPPPVIRNGPQPEPAPKETVREEVLNIVETSRGPIWQEPIKVLPSDQHKLLDRGVYGPIDLERKQSPGMRNDPEKRRPLYQVSNRTQGYEFGTLSNVDDLDMGNSRTSSTGKTKRVTINEVVQYEKDPTFTAGKPGQRSSVSPPRKPLWGNQANQSKPNPSSETRSSTQTVTIILI